LFVFAFRYASDLASYTAPPCLLLSVVVVAAVVVAAVVVAAVEGKSS